MVNSLNNLKNAAVLAAFFVLAVLAGCSSDLEIEKLSGRTMGTNWSVVIANPMASTTKRKLKGRLKRFYSR